jgi:3-oxoacyl-[acyl-carrier protein] reductase
MKLANRVAVVTGGAQGIGAACALALAEHGARVLIGDLNEVGAAALVKDIAARGGLASFQRADVGDKADCEALAEQAVAQYGSLDILVNNAGIVRDTLLAMMTEEQWREVLQTNLDSVFNFCQAVTRPMMSQRSGRIVNMSSVAANHGNKGQANYAASKGGIEGFTRCLATELASRGVTVNAIAPGFIETDMTVAVRNAFEGEIKKRIPLKRLGQGADIAGAVAFLVGDDASYMTGQVLTVDGGLSLGGF